MDRRMVSLFTEEWNLSFPRYLGSYSLSTNYACFLTSLQKKVKIDLSIQFFTIGVSVRLSDRSLHREEQKNFVKNCPQWGLKPGPPDLQANVLPNELSRNLLGRRSLKWALFVSCTTSHVGLCSFLELIEHDFIKTMKIQAGNWMLT